MQTNSNASTVEAATKVTEKAEIRTVEDFARNVNVISDQTRGYLVLLGKLDDCLCDFSNLIEQEYVLEIAGKETDKFYDAILKPREIVEEFLIASINLRLGEMDGEI